MVKRFIASAGGIKVSNPGNDVDIVSDFELLFSSDRYLLSGALIGSVFSQGESYDDGFGFNEFDVPLPAGTGDPLWWQWPVRLSPLTVRAYSSYVEPANVLRFKIWRNQDVTVKYIIYRNRF